MGDYEVKHNSLTSSGVPTMHAGKNSVRIKHKEFLTDITGSTGFENRLYTINPGSSETFPWLSNIACMFQSYKIHGMCFVFNSTSADALNSVNTALGTVIMATQYNVALPAFVNKPEMEQYEFTCTTKPSQSLTHCIECDPSLQVMPHLFTRTGVLPSGQDYQFYDWGEFQLATVGMQAAATIGELWVTYDIEFFKPRIAAGGAWPGDFMRVTNGTPSNAFPLGTLLVAPTGNLPVTVNGTTITFDSSISAGRYRITVVWQGTVNAAFTAPSRTLSNCTLSNYFTTNTASEFTIPLGGATTNRAAYEGVVTINGYSPNGSTITFGAAGSLPTGTNTVDICIDAIPLSDDSF